MIVRVVHFNSEYKSVEIHATKTGLTISYQMNEKFNFRNKLLRNYDDACNVHVKNIGL